MFDWVVDICYLNFLTNEVIGQKNSNDFSSHYYYIIYLLIVGSPFFGEDQNSKKSKGD